MYKRFFKILQQASGNQAGRDLTITQTVIISFVPPILLLTLIYSIYVFGLPAFQQWRNQPDVMDGDFNIIVAEFNEQPSKDGVGKAFSQLLFDTLEQEYRVLQATDQRIKLQHEHIGVIRTIDEAQKLAEKLNADLIIFGTVTVNQDAVIVSPKFYVASDSQQTLSELSGLHSISDPTTFPKGALLNGTADISTKSTLLIEFTKGMSYMLSRNFNLAGAAFSKAIIAAESIHQQSGSNLHGEEVLYLAASSNAIFRSDFENAQQYLQTALARNESYARAYIGLGNLYYAQVQGAQQRNDPNAMRELLATALSFYEQALRIEDQTLEGLVHEKARLSMGNVYLILYQIAEDENQDRFAAEATSHYQAVIDAYAEAEAENLRHLAGMANYAIAVIRYRQYDYAGSCQFLQQSLSLLDEQTADSANAEALLKELRKVEPCS